MLKEFCAENLTNVCEAIIAGAQRIELCDCLAVGGISPSSQVIEATVSVSHGLGARVMVMVRPRGGDFCYSLQELQTMEETIRTAQALGADGVVFGCVSQGQLDLAATRRLAQTATGLDLTFHMAFDEIDSDAQPGALATLAKSGFSRVLTHGGPLSEGIDNCLPHLKELVTAAGDRIAIMPGGGVTWENCERICEHLGVEEVHGTRIVAW